MCPFGSSRKGFSLAGNKPRLGFIGAGRAGGALARTLARAGYREIVVASRNPDSARALAASLPGIRAVTSGQAAVDAADIVFITTPDAAIETVVRALVWAPGKSVVHTSGAESRQILAHAAGTGGLTGSLHPLQTFAAIDEQADLAGVTFALEADEPLKSRLLAIVADIGGIAVVLQVEDRALYHAAAVFMSNYTVTLTKLATDLWAAFGHDHSEALQALLPLLEGTVANLKAMGLPGALTGPVERGDITTIERHLKALAERAPAVLATYRDLGTQTVELALAKGSIDEVVAKRLGALFGGGSGGRAAEVCQTEQDNIDAQKGLEARS
jgi:predicted short-subunit dehydrogenase-like oxidoreductase (DUF2520 family)